MLENTKLFLALKRPKKSTAPKRSGQYLFNQHNLGRYESDVKKGLELIKRTIAENEQPFSGILPQELAPVFKDINLDRPLNKTDKALEELSEVYLKDAVYFHNPKYVAHLNCPIVYPTVMAAIPVVIVISLLAQKTKDQVSHWYFKKHTSSSLWPIKNEG
jgi:L-2,4-diaminobutyrate decarboxylase